MRAKKKGYRFIVNNVKLKRITGLKIPRKTFDSVGQIMAYEQGELDDKQTLALFKHLRKTGMIDRLQGHYGRTAANLRV